MIIKFITRIFIFLLSTQLSAQINTDEKFNKVEIGAGFSTDYNTAFLKTNGTNRFADSLRNINIPTWLYSGGFTLQYNFNKNIGLESGIRYARKGYETKFFYLIYDYDGFSSEPPPFLTIKEYFSYHYIEIPFKINYTVGKKAVRFISTIGVTADILLAESYLGGISGKAARSTSWKHFPNRNRFGMSTTVGAGVNFKVNDRFHFNVLPTFLSSIVSYTKDTPMKVYFWNVGLDMGLYYGLK